MVISKLEWFDEGLFAFPNVPENTASGEIIIGSLYRELGLAFAKEGEVGSMSIDLKSRIRQGFNENGIHSPSGLKIEQLEYILTQLTSSPLLKNQAQSKSAEYFFFSPLLPSFANYSNAARLKGNPWNPGGYILKMIYRGAGDEAPKVIKDLKNALAINLNGTDGVKDDIWARFVSQEISVWEKPLVNEEFARTKDEGISLDFNCPSNRLANDIVHLIKLKAVMTRKRWIAILEAYLRFILALDAIWICQIQSRLTGWIEKTYSESPNEFVGKDLTQYSFFSIGHKRDSVIQYFTKEYAKHSLLNNGIQQYAISKKVEHIQLNSSESIIKFLESFKQNITIKEFQTQKEQILRYIDSNEMDRITGKPGRTNNISEFLTYAPGRRNTAKEAQSSYDQGYWYKKAGAYKSAPWLFEMGPASLTTMVYLSCIYYQAPTISVADFIEFIRLYGIDINQKEIASGVTGKHLRMLGLVIDSPDSEGGIIINQPFKL